MEVNKVWNKIKATSPPRVTATTSSSPSASPPLIRRLYRSSSSVPNNLGRNFQQHFGDRSAFERQLRSSLLHLPDELLLFIMSFLDITVLFKLCRTSKRFYRLSEDAKLLRRTVQSRWSEYEDRHLQIPAKLLKSLYRLKTGEVSWDGKRKAPGILLSENNLVAMCDNGYWNTVRASHGLSFGVWVWEIRVRGRSRPTLGIGLVGDGFKQWRQMAGGSEDGWVLDETGKVRHGAHSRRVCSPLLGNDVIGVFVDMQRRVLGFYKNRKYLVTIHDLPAVVFPAVSLSGKDLAVQLEFSPIGYRFPTLAADLSPLSFSLEADPFDFTT